MTVRLECSFAETEAEVRACWPVMAQLRSALTEAEFVDRVQRQRLAGYRLVAGRIQQRVLVVAGFVVGEKLAWGRHLYVDDLVTDAAARSLGAGRAMLVWLRRHAVDAGCASLHLDSGLQRPDAHRFYAREGLLHAGAHFSVELAPSAVPAKSGPEGADAHREGVLRLRTGGGPLSEDTLYPQLDDAQEDDDLDPSHEAGLDPDFR